MPLKTRMNLTRKTTFFFAALATLVVIAVLAISIFSFRHMYLNAAQTQAKTAAEIVRVHLTESMVNGTISLRQQFFKRLNSVNGLVNTRIARGPEVIAQYGPGFENEQSLDHIEKKVISTGQPHFELLDDHNGPLLRASIPYIAEVDGTPNCLSCHKVSAGKVLGVITLHVSVAEQRRQSAVTTGLVLSIVTFFALGA